MLGNRVSEDLRSQICRTEVGALRLKFMVWEKVCVKHGEEKRSVNGLTGSEWLARGSSLCPYTVCFLFLHRQVLRNSLLVL